MSVEEINKQISAIRGHMDAMSLILNGIDCSQIECNECPMFRVTCMKPILNEMLENGM